MAGKPAELRISGRCGLSCAPCDCNYSPSSEEQCKRALDAGGTRLTLRGGTGDWVSLRSLLDRASGFSEIAVRLPACGLSGNGADTARALAQARVTTAIVPLFSHIAEAHDLVAGEKGAMVRALVGARALASAGIAVELEVPLLSPRFQSPEAVVELAHRAIASLRAVRFFVPRHALPASLAPAEWPIAGAALAAGLRKARALGVDAKLRPSDGIPLCALKGHDDVQDAYRFDKRRAVTRLQGCELHPPCDDCAVKSACAGVALGYGAVHGSKGLSPFGAPIDRLYEQRTTPLRRWTEEQKRAASAAPVLVLRPTVNCNQDCTFCSANETSKNVWDDSGAMLRAIARAGRRGVEHLSISGGEPTLSRQLPAFVRAAKRVGIPKIELITNAVLLDNPKRVAELAEAGLTNAFVSLHAHDEAISRSLTQKAGDHARTLRGVELLLDAGVRTALNHVISARNFQYLVHFVETVHKRFGGRAKISFAFVTPQFKALENIDLVPRLSEVMPYLRRAMRRALELGQPFVVGARQGVPPCFLREFQAWSDVIDCANEAISEDAPQKERGPACADCRYQEMCPGLWKPYVARFGTDELVALRGPRVNEDDARALHVAHAVEWAFIRRFDDVPEALRDRDAENEALAALEAPKILSLPVLPSTRSRPLRLLMLGTGHQARRLARALENVAGAMIEGVASPHAPDADLSAFGGCPAYRDAADALDGMRPEAVIVAAATPAHAALVAEARARGVPVLVEKPLTRTEAEAEALLADVARGGSVVMPAHAVLHASGLEQLWSSAPHTSVVLVRRTPRHSPDAPTAWGRGALSETLYHLLVMTGRACGGGVAEVAHAQSGGDSAPERVVLNLRYPRGEAELRLDFRAAQDELMLATTDAQGHERLWHRTGGAIVAGPREAPRPVEREGSDSERMLARFRDVVLGRAAPSATVADALDVMRTVRAAIAALEAAGAPFDRASAPVHVATRVAP